MGAINAPLYKILRNQRLKTGDASVVTDSNLHDVAAVLVSAIDHTTLLFSYVNNLTLTIFISIVETVILSAVQGQSF